MIDEKRLIKDLEGFSKDEGSLAIYGTKLKSIIYDCIIEVEKQPKISEWIPCDEKYPEWGTESYLVCLKNGGIFLAIYLSSGEFKEISSMGIREFCENNPVIAWQPLPEPYKS